MALYVTQLTDVPPTRLWPWPQVAYLTADTKDELIQAAADLFIPPCCYNDYHGSPFYCITPRQRQVLLEDGAVDRVDDWLP